MSGMALGMAWHGKALGMALAVCVCVCVWLDMALDMALGTSSPYTIWLFSLLGTDPNHKYSLPETLLPVITRIGEGTL